MDTDCVEYLRNKISTLESKLSETEKNLYTSAVYGKNLLDENVSLKAKLSETSKNENRIEELLQEKHKLVLQVDALKNQEQNLRDELDLLGNQHRTQLKNAEDLAKHQATLLSKELADLQSENEELKLQVKVYDERTKELEKQMSELEEKVMQESKGQEALLNSHFKDELQKLSAERAFLVQNTQEEKQKTEMLQKQIDNLQKQNVILSQEVEEKECQASSFAQALENCRAEVTDLKTELALAKTEEPNPSKRGNSLFGELDDRRQKLENHIRYLRMKNDKIRKQNEENQKLIFNLKVQKTDVILSASKKVDPSYVEGLELRLTQAYAMNGELHAKLRTKAEALFLCKTCKSEVESNQTEGDYGYLKIMLSQARNHVQDLEKEKQSIWLQYASERDEARKSRKELCSALADLESLRNENNRLLTENEELLCKHAAHNDDKMMDKENVFVMTPPLKSQVDSVIENITLDESKSDPTVKHSPPFKDNKPQVRVTEKSNECKQQ